MFSIRVLPPEESDIDGVRLGEIIIGDFTEQFACYTILEPVDRLDNLWRMELHKLIDGAASVALVHDPRFAWIIYREGGHCFIQQALSLNGDFGKRLATRVTLTEEGYTVSEWQTNISTIAQFIGKQNAA